MSITDVKNYWNNRPCNIRHSRKDVGTMEYFDEVEIRKYLVEPHIPSFAEFSKWNCKNVLEIGCGIGTDSINFARNGACITCTDLSEESLQLCKLRFKKYGLSADFYLTNAEELSKTVPIKSYDLIYSFGVIHHTPNPEKVIEEISNYMDNNTEVRIMLYSKYSWKALEFFFLNGWKFSFNWDRTIQYYAEAQLGCPVAFTYTRKSIKKLLENYTIISIKKDHIFPYKIKDYIQYKYNKRFIFKFLSKKLFHWLESVLGWHYLITFKKK